MGLLPDELEQFTPVEFQNKVKGHFEAITRKEKEDWERTRAAVLTICSCLVNKQADLNKIRDNWKFDWEREKVVKNKPSRFTPQELEKQLAAMDKHHLEMLKKGHG